MTVRKATNKVHNKKLRRRREGLLTKAYEYGELDGVELTLFIRYPKRGEFYYYTSKEGLPWLRDVEEKASLVSYPLPVRFLIETDGTSQGEERVHRKREEKSGGDATKAEESEECVFMERRGQ